MENTSTPPGTPLLSDASRRPTLGTTQRTKPKKTRRTKRTTTAKTTATTGLPDLQITVKPPVSSFSPDCTKAQTPFGTAGYSCGGVLSDPAGSFSSPLYPGQYPNKAQCMWQIEVKGNLCIKVIIGSLRLEPSPDCVSDYVAVYDGPFGASPLLGQICQNSYYNFTSTSNVITVQFVSGLSGTDMGFQVVYYAYKCDTGSIGMLWRCACGQSRNIEC
ncbi:deleted in malignant brain tumors 1 protein-like [Ambystoma mexicanum]|uniref:deleted in malignant brain tumors 1 protein-like n=1 Tax=Ambystoma mexicanum TaxID=8296 RepID=UPI0037E93F44